VSSFLIYVVFGGVALGIFVRSLLPFGIVEIVWVACVGIGLAALWRGKKDACFVAGVVGLGWAAVWRRKSSAFSAPFLLGTSVLLIFFSLGALRMEVAFWNEISTTFEPQLETTVSFEGIVMREPDVRTRTQHLYIETEGERILVTTNPYLEVKYGDRVLVEGKLTKPEAFETDLGRTFDYKGYLRARGVSYMISFAEVTVTGAESGNAFVSALLNFKNAFLVSIESTIPAPEVGLAAGLLLGVKQALGEDLEEAFRKAGITHIVVLSGYNIMLVVAFVMYVLALILPFRARLIVGLAAIVAFACMVGLSATVVRASIMAALILIAKITGRTYEVIRALLIAALVMLIVNPYLLVYDVGFQFSFIATLGLILIAPQLEKYVGFMPTRLGLREFLTATLATQIFITPILLYQMGEFSVVSVIVNMMILPMVPVAMLLTFATGMIGFFSTTLAMPIAYTAYLSLLYIITVAERFAALPFSAFSVPSFPFIVVVCSYGIMAALLWRAYTTENLKKDSLSAWTIVDESSLKDAVLGSQGDPKTASIQTPIFFR